MPGGEKNNLQSAHQNAAPNHNTTHVCWQSLPRCTAVYTGEKDN